MSNYDYIEQGGHKRVFALKPRTMPVGDNRCCTGVVGIGSAPALIPRKDWPKCVDLTPGCSDEITDQNGHSLCHSYAGTGVNQDAHHLAGRKDVKLSIGYLAGLVTGGQDEGAGVDEVLAVLLKHGQCRRETIGNEDFRHRSFPDKANEEALEYRPLDVWDCGNSSTFDGVCSNLILGNVCEIGTFAWGGGHAVEQAGYFMLGDRIFAIGKNSWGTDWSNWDQRMLDEFAKVCPMPDKSKILLSKGAGYWVFSEPKISNGMETFGAWGLQSTRANEDDSVPAAT